MRQILGGDELEADSENIEPQAADVNANIIGEVTPIKAAPAATADCKRGVSFAETPQILTLETGSFATAESPLAILPENTDTWKGKFLESQDEVKRLVAAVDAAEASRDAQHAAFHRATNDLNNERLTAKRAADSLIATKEELASLREEAKALDIACMESRETAERAAERIRKLEAEAEYERTQKRKAQAALADCQTSYQQQIETAEAAIADLKSAVETEAKRRVHAEQSFALEQRARHAANTELAAHVAAVKDATEEAYRNSEIGAMDRASAEQTAKEKAKALAQLADEQRRRIDAEAAFKAAIADAAESVRAKDAAIAALEARLAVSAAAEGRAVNRSDAARHGSALAAAKASELTDNLTSATGELRDERARCASLQTMLEEALGTLEATQAAFDAQGAAKTAVETELAQMKERSYGHKVEATSAAAAAQVAQAAEAAAADSVSQLERKLEIATKAQAAAVAEAAEAKAKAADAMAALETAAKAADVAKAAAAKALFAQEEKTAALATEQVQTARQFAEESARLASANDEVRKLTLTLQRLQSEVQLEAAAKARAEAALRMENAKVTAMQAALTDARAAHQMLQYEVERKAPFVLAALESETKKRVHAEREADLTAKAEARSQAEVAESKAEAKAAAVQMARQQTALQAAERAAERERQSKHRAELALAAEQASSQATEATLQEKMAAWASAEAALTSTAAQAEGLARREHEQRLMAERQFDMALHQAVVGTPQKAAHIAAAAAVASPYRVVAAPVVVATPPVALATSQNAGRRQNPRRAAAAGRQ